MAGVDEAGRGCLAGPLVAAAVCFDMAAFGRADARALRHVDDSKRVPAGVRAELALEIVARARQVVVVSVAPASIDRRGLHVCNLAALSRALAGLVADEALCLVDGFALGEGARPHRRVVGGDRTSFCIAAASVVAKEARDRLMRGPATLAHPDHGFDEHVGYATPAHRAAIHRHGPTPMHRMSFRSAAYTGDSATGVTTPAGVTSASGDAAAPADM